GWPSQWAYQDYLSYLSQSYGSGSFFSSISGIPIVPNTPQVPDAQDPVIAQKQKDCKEVHDQKMKESRDAATEKLGFCAAAYGGAQMKLKKERGQSLLLLVCVYWVLNSLENTQDVIRAEYKQCHYNASHP
ncbi:MAG: hypothetical protein H7Z75_05435, partial [Ferruginibacter sp.]|nr:hypothetical protein [Cytophagales bacterium]